jgi:hypothetical protein
MIDPSALLVGENTRQLNASRHEASVEVSQEPKRPVTTWTLKQVE